MKSLRFWGSPCGSREHHFTLHRIPNRFFNLLLKLLQMQSKEAQRRRGVKNHLREDLRHLHGTLLHGCKHITLSSWALFPHL